jgi:hypothetical protein
MEGKTNMKKNKQGKEPVAPRTMLQIRVVHQDYKGSIRDVTQDDKGHGLKDLQWRASCAADTLICMSEKLKLLSLAMENRTQIDTDVVRHIIEEVSQRLEVGSDVVSYVQYTQDLFEGAMALPWISGIKPRVFDNGHLSPKKADHSLALVS